MSIGNALKSIRSRANMTQSEFANYLNTPLGTYRNWEQDLRDPETKRLVEIAQLLNTSVDYLFGMTSDPEPYPPAVPYAAKMAPGFDISDLNEDDRDAIAEYVELRKLKRRMEREGDEK